MYILDGILDSDDMFCIVGIYFIYHRGKRGGFTTSRRSCYEYESLPSFGYILVDKREVQVFYGRIFCDKRRRTVI